MHDNQTASVTVIIPCFRCSQTIRRAVESVINQTLKPTEVILVDDASGDATLESLREIKKEYSDLIKLVVLENNLGAAGARNAGWNLATQEYLAFLDADDTWHPKKLEIQYAYMKSHSDVVLCGHSHKGLKQTNMCSDWGIDNSCSAVPISKWQLLLSNKFITPSVMLRSDVQHRFFPGQRHMEDHMLWLDILCSGGGGVAKISTPLAAIYKGPFGDAGLSSQIWLMEKADVNNYRTCLEKEYINIGQWLILTIYSCIKFVRRLVICWLFSRR